MEVGSSGRQKPWANNRGSSGQWKLLSEISNLVIHTIEFKILNGHFPLDNVLSLSFFDLVAPPSPQGIAPSYIVERQVMTRTLIHPAIQVPFVKIEYVKEIV